MDPADLHRSRLDGKGIFRQGLSSIRAKLEERYYTSISTFSSELASVFTSEIGVQPAGDTAELQMQIAGRAPELSLEQREKRKLAKRIIKSIQPALEDAIKKESELHRRPFEQELKDLDVMFENSVLSRRGSEVGEPMEEDELPKPETSEHTDNGMEDRVEEVENNTDQAAKEPSDTAHVPEPSEQEPQETPMVDAEETQNTEPLVKTQKQPPADLGTDMPSITQETQELAPEVVSTAVQPSPAEPATNGEPEKYTDPSLPASNNHPIDAPNGPLTPPPSFKGDQQHPLAQGGIQWYMQPFDPIGTTIHEERWTGRDVMRGMSEELSELDEDELKDLVDDELDGQGDPREGAAGGMDGLETRPAAQNTRTRSRRRLRGL